MVLAVCTSTRPFPEGGQTGLAPTAITINSAVMDSFWPFLGVTSTSLAEVRRRVALVDHHAVAFELVQDHLRLAGDDPIPGA